MGAVARLPGIRQPPGARPIWITDLRQPPGDGRFPAPGLGEWNELAGVDLIGRSPGPGQFLFELIDDFPGVIAGAMFPGDAPESVPGLH